MWGLSANQNVTKIEATGSHLPAAPSSLVWNYAARNALGGLYKSLLSGFEYNNSEMGKKSFVRVVVGSREYRLSRSDITRTHFIKKRTVPRVPSFCADAKRDDFSLELENTNFYDVCFKGEESSEDECEVDAVNYVGRGEWKY